MALDGRKRRRRRPGGRAAVIAFLLLGVGCLIALAFALDAPVREAILDSQGRGWKKTGDYQVQSTVSRYGDWPQLMILGALGFGLAAWRGRADWRRVMLAAMMASTLAGILANTSRLTTGRTRPRESPRIEAGWYGLRHEGRWLIGDSKFNAFPSGHTATAVGFAATILFAKPWVGFPALGMALWIAWSRMALGAHHLSDVVVSILLAVGVGWFVLRWCERRGDTMLAAVRHRIEIWLRRG